MRTYEYIDIYNVFDGWAEEGKLPQAMTCCPRNGDKYTAFDAKIIRSLGFKTNGNLGFLTNDNQSVHSVACTITDKLKNGDLNLDWLMGPNGYALWRAKQVKKNSLQES